MTAPNEKIFIISEKEKLSEVIEKIAASLPAMPDAVWSVDTGTKTIAYIIMETRSRYRYELCEKDRYFTEMGIHYLHCRYFHEGRFTYRDRISGELIEKYPECPELLEKVKCFMGEYFRKKLKIKCGSVCIWGEWFGRPHDNFHRVKNVEWKEESISIHFEGGESLYMKEPEGIVNKEGVFSVKNASEVLWTWYLYGEKQIYRNLYVRRYAKQDDGSILRAEGKRRDVKQDSGAPFRIKGQYAVLIE